LNIEDIDCIISANATMQQMIPYDGAGIHKLLNLNETVSSFDINMTCLSALRSLEISSHLIDSYSTILIVSCEVPSVALDWSDIRTAGIFSDGCSAMIIQKSSKGGIITSNFETHSEGFDFCQILGGGVKNPPSTYSGNYTELCNFKMNGKKLFKLTLKTLLKFIEKTLAKKELILDDIDWIVPHQASQASLNHMIRLLKIDKTKFIDIFVNHGNQVASSIPTALHELFTTKNVKSGDKVMLIGTSAGLGLGMIVLEMP
jgi:3-oxoacyl-[acyl-carrier-protein] synthase-3